MSFNYPFTPITGQGLGISYSSFTQIGAIFPHIGLGQAKLKLYINVSNGNLSVFDHSLVLKEMNGDLLLGFCYNSQAAALAQAWQFSLKKLVQIPCTKPLGTSLVMQEEDGHLTIYQRVDGSHFMAPGHSDGSASMYYIEQEQHWRWFHPKTQVTEIYNTHGQLLTRTDAAGRVTQFDYVGESLNTISGPTGNCYQIRRSGTMVEVDAIIGGAAYPLQWHEFDVLGRLITTTIAKLNYHIHYDYKGDSQYLNAIRQTDGTEIAISYDIDKRISRIDAGEPGFRFSYPNQDQPYIKILDSLNRGIELTLDAEGRLATLTRENGYNKVLPIKDRTQYQYTPAGQVQSISHPDAGIITYQYDSSSGVVLQVTDPEAEITQYYYFLDAGARVPYRPVSTVKFLQDQACVTYYIYDTQFKNQGEDYLFLRFVVHPSSRVSEYLPDAYGNVASERHYLAALFDTNEHNKHPSAPISLSEIQNWVTKQDLSKSSLTEYSYDPRGQIQKTTRYTKVDQQGKGVVNTSTGMEITLWDEAGNLLTHEIQQTPFLVSKTVQHFDRLNRLIYQLNPLEAETKYEYDDSASQVKITYPSGRSLVKTWDSAEQITAITEIATNAEGEFETRNSAYNRDQVGHPIITSMPDGQLCYRFYDRQNRLGFTISPSGVVTQHQYDEVHRYQSTTIYNTRINPQDLYEVYPPDPAILPNVGKLIAVILPKITDPLHDRTNYQCFDKTKRLCYEIDALGVLTETRYDSLKRKMFRITYHQALNAEQMQAIKQGETLTISPDFKKDRCMRYFYDLDGLVIGQQDAAGYVKEFIRDGGGKITERILYANKININLAITDFDAIRPTPDPNHDAHTYYIRDQRGQTLAKVDAEGYLSTYQYFPCGLKQEARQYANPMLQAWFNNPTILPNLPNPSTEDRLSQYQYNALNQPVAIDSSSGTVLLFQYDQNAHLLEKRQQDLSALECIDPDHQRNTRTQYDGWEQITAEANPFTGQLLATIEADPSLPPNEKAKKIAAIWQNQSIRHSYTASGLKLSTSNALGDITLYYYDLDRQPIIDINSLGVVVETTRNSSGEVISTRRYANRLDPETMKTLIGGFLTDSLRAKLNSLQDPAKDELSLYERNQQGQVTKKIDPEGAMVITTYNAFKEVDTEYLPIADKTPSLMISYEYEPRGLTTKTTETDGNVSISVIQRYDNLYGKKTDHIDANKNLSEWEYNRNGVLIETINAQGGSTLIVRDAFSRPASTSNPLAAVTKYAYDQVKRTSTVILPEGNTRTETANIFGENITVRDGLGYAEQIQHAPNGMVTELTDVLGYKAKTGFDLMGQKILVTDQNGVKTCFQLDAAGCLLQKRVDTEGLNITSTYIRDAFGNAIQIEDPRQTKIIQTFDRRNKKLSRIFAPDGEERGAQVSMAWGYNNQAALIIKIQGDTNNPRQYVETYLQDGFNRSSGKIIDPDQLKITSAQHLDAKGNVIAEIDANTHVKRHFYDELNQERFFIDAEGGVLETLYDAAGRSVLTRHYQFGLDPSLLNDQTTLNEVSKLLHQNVEDSCQYCFYDLNDSLRFKVNSLGGVEEQRYDLNKQEILRISYATRIDPASIPGLTTDKLAALMQSKASRDDRKHYQIRDAQGLVRFCIDGENYIEEYRLDSRANKIAEILYAIPVSDPNALLTIAVDEIYAKLAKDSREDSVTYRVYDSINRPVFVISPEGRVSRYQYDPNNNLVETVVFSTGISLPDNYSDPVYYNTVVVEVQALQPDPAKDAITSSKFDVLNRKYQDIDALKNKDQYQSNAVGDITQHIDREGQAWNYIYDSAHRLTDEATPPVPVTTVTATPNNILGLSFLPSVNKHLLEAQLEDPYHADDINALIRIRVEQQLGGYLPRYQFLLAKTYEDQGLLDQEKRAYHVVITPALDNQESACSLYFYLDERALVAGQRASLNRIDVFDELSELLLTQDTLAIKILFPYRFNLEQWVLGEILIYKMGQHYDVELWTHNPSGSGHYLPSETEVLAEIIIRQLQSLAPDAKINIQVPHKSLYEQSRVNSGHASGVMVVEELCRRVKGLALTNLEQPLKVLQQQQVREIETHFSSADRLRTGFLERRSMAQEKAKVRLDKLQVEKTIPSISLSTSQSLESIVNHKEYNPDGTVAKISLGANTAAPRIMEVHYNKNQKPIKTLIRDVAIDDPSKAASFVVRPEENMDLSTETVYDAKGQKVAECNQAYLWHFYIYDSSGRELYQVSADASVISTQRNSFGEIISKTSFSIAVNLDLSQYIHSGIPRAVLESALQPNPDEDRVETYERDRRGLVIHQSLGPIFYYLPNGDQPKFGFASPETTWQYNAHRKITVKSWLIDPESDTWARELTWYNRTNFIMALCDAEDQVKLYQRNGHGKEIQRLEWAEKSVPAPTAATTLADLEASHVRSAQDRTYVSEYDLLQQLIRFSLKNQVVQELEFSSSNIPSFHNLPIQDLSRSYSYTAVQKRASVTYEDGGCEYHFYDARGLELASTGVSRESVAQSGKTEIIVPLTYYGNDAFGARVATTKFKQGTVPVSSDFRTQGRTAKVYSAIYEHHKSNEQVNIASIAHRYELLPTPIAIDPEDQTELSLMDVKRGKPIYQQDANGQVRAYTYTATAKVARQFYLLTNHDAQHLDEKRFRYDCLDRPEALIMLRDDQVLQSTLTTYNNFGEAIAEGMGDGSWPLYRRFDRLGQCWSSNTEVGVITLTLTDLSKRSSVSLKSATKDLSGIKEADLANILSWSIEDLERVETSRDRVGRPISKTLPSYIQENPNIPGDLPLNIVIGTAYPELGKMSASWVQMQETNVLPKLTLWPRANSSQKKMLPVAKFGDRYGVDLTQLPTDVYSYVIDYYWMDPETGIPTDKVLYQSNGQFQMDTGINQDSLGVVGIVAKDESTLNLSGATKGLTAIQLWQDNKEVATVPVIETGKTSEFTADLSRYPSGTYTMMPVIDGKASALQSLPFSIYTQEASHLPLARQINTCVELKTLNQEGNCYGQLIWKMNERLMGLSVNLICQYLDIQGNTETHKDTIKVGTDKGHYTDKNGKILLCNTIFEHQVQAIQALSLALELSSSETITVVDQFSVAASSGDGTKLILDTSFAAASVLYITPLPGYMVPPIINYLDVSEDRLATWKQLMPIGITSLGVVVDVTAFVPANYPYKIGSNVSGVLEVAHAETIVYSSTPMPPAPPVKTQASCYYFYDAWNNVLKEVNTLGAETTYTYNAFNKCSERLQPLVTVMDKDQKTYQVQPLTVYAYNLRAVRIGVRDPNQHTEAFLLDSAGQMTVHILADGTTDTRQSFDALARVSFYQDSRAGVYTLIYDHRNNILQQIFPSKNTLHYGVNEANRRNFQASYDGKISFYDYDGPALNIQTTIMPEGTVTQMVYERNRKPISLTYAVDGTKLSWQRDYFGQVHSHINLNKIQYSYVRDYKGQIIMQTADKAPANGTLSLFPKTIATNVMINPQKKICRSVNLDYYYVPYASHNATQFLTFKYSGDQLVEVRDQACGQVISYTRDTEGRPITEEISRNAQVLRQISTEYDALSRPIYSSGTQMVLSIYYDAASNRRAVSSTLYPPKGIPPVLTTEAYLYDAADREIISAGKFEGNSIVIAKGQGWQYKYEAGLRQQQIYQDAAGMHVTTIAYNADGLPNTTHSNDGVSTNRGYDGAGRQNHYSKNNGESRDTVFNDNGWLVTETQRDEHGKVTRSNFSDFNSQGLPRVQDTHYLGEDVDEDQLSIAYADPGSDSFSRTKIGGRRHDKNGWGAYNEIDTHYDANGIINAQIGLVDVTLYNKYTQERKTAYYETTYDGRILRKYVFHHGDGGDDSRFSDKYWTWTPNYEITEYFYSITGIFIGSYTFMQRYNYGDASKILQQGYLTESGGYIRSSLNQGRYISRGSVSARQASIGGTFPLQNPYVPMSNCDVALIFAEDAINYHGIISRTNQNKLSFEPLSELRYLSSGFNPVMPFSSSYPATPAAMYTVKAGDTLETIAENLFGDASFSTLIGQNNGGLIDDNLVTGLMIQVPVLMPYQNKAWMSRPYDDFLSIMIASIYPYLQAAEPKHHHSFFGEIIALITVMVGVALGNALGGVLARSLFGVAAVTGATIGAASVEALTVAVTVGLLSAAEQGLAVYEDWQAHFSLKQSVVAGIEAALFAYAQDAHYLKKLESAIISYGTLAVSDQLVEMAAGLRKKFDFTAVLVSVAENLAASFVMDAAASIEKEYQLVKKVVSTSVSSLVTDIIGGVAAGNVDIENIAAKALGGSRDSILRERALGIVAQITERYPAKPEKYSYRGVSPQTQAQIQSSGQSEEVAAVFWEKTIAEVGYGEAQTLSKTYDLKPQNNYEFYDELDP